MRTEYQRIFSTNSSVAGQETTIFQIIALITNTNFWVIGIDDETQINLCGLMQTCGREGVVDEFHITCCTGSNIVNVVLDGDVSVLHQEVVRHHLCCQQFCLRFQIRSHDQAKEEG